MPFDRTQQTARQTHYTSVPDATGIPFQQRTAPEGGRVNSVDSRDYRDQADGAP